MNFNPTYKRRLWLALGSLIAVLAACNSEVKKQPSSTLTILSQREPYFGPQYFTDWKFLLFEPLVWFDEQGEIIPRLAQEWKHSPDYCEWTYHLRSDVFWHDGIPFTSKDVKFTVELYAGPPTGYYTGLKEVLIPDDTTVIIRTHKPKRPDWFTVYYPEHLLRDLDPEKLWEWDFWSQPVGNGPYCFNRYLPKTLWEFKANEDYYAGRPAINQIRIRIGSSNHIMELLAGNVDAVPYFNRSALLKLKSYPQFRVYYNLSLDASSFDAIWWNHNHPLFSSAKVRRALTLAIDRQELLSSQNIPDTVPITDVPFTIRQLLHHEIPAPLPFDPDQAIKLMEESGWHDIDRDGIREKGNIKASFTALANSGMTDFAAVYVQAAFRRIGVKMNIQLLPRDPRQELGAGKFEAVFDRYLPLQLRLHWTGYQNESIKRLFTAADATVDPALMDDYFRHTWNDFLRDIPLTFLGQQIHSVVVHERVQGLSTPLQANPYYHARELYIVDRKTRQKK